MVGIAAINRSSPVSGNNVCNPPEGAVVKPHVWSRQDALALYQANEDYALLAVNRFLRDYPGAISSVRDKEDLLSDARLILWRCCEVYDPGRGALITTMAFRAVYRRLLDSWKQNFLRMENGHMVPTPKLVSYEDDRHVFQDVAEMSRPCGGQWGSDGLAAILHWERLQKVQAVWAARDAYRRAKSPVMAAELEAVLSIQYIEF